MGCPAAEVVAGWHGRKERDSDASGGREARENRCPGPGCQATPALWGAVHNWRPRCHRPLIGASSRLLAWGAGARPPVARSVVLATSPLRGGIRRLPESPRPRPDPGLRCSLGATGRGSKSGVSLPSSPDRRQFASLALGGRGSAPSREKRGSRDFPTASRHSPPDATPGSKARPRIPILAATPGSTSRILPSRRYWMQIKARCQPRSKEVSD